MQAYRKAGAPTEGPPTRSGSTFEGDIGVDKTDVTTTPSPRLQRLEGSERFWVVTPRRNGEPRPQQQVSPLRSIQVWRGARVDFEVRMQSLVVGNDLRQSCPAAGGFGVYLPAAATPHGKACFSTRAAYRRKPDKRKNRNPSSKKSSVLALGPFSTKGHVVVMVSRGAEENTARHGHAGPWTRAEGTQRCIRRRP